MIKKIAALALCLVISMSVCAFAEETADAPADTPAQSNTMPPEGMKPGGGRGFGGRGQRPEGGMTPPQGGEFQPGSMPPQESGEQPEGTPPQMPAQDDLSTEDAQTEQSETAENFFKKYSTPLFSMVLLGLAFVFVIFYKRKTF